MIISFFNKNKETHKYYASENIQYLKDFGQFDKLKSYDNETELTILANPSTMNASCADISSAIRSVLKKNPGIQHINLLGFPHETVNKVTLEILNTSPNVKVHTKKSKLEEIEKEFSNGNLNCLLEKQVDATTCVINSQKKYTEEVLNEIKNIEIPAPESVNELNADLTSNQLTKAEECLKTILEKNSTVKFVGESFFDQNKSRIEEKVDEKLKEIAALREKMENDQIARDQATAELLAQKEQMKNLSDALSTVIDQIEVKWTHSPDLNKSEEIIRKNLSQKPDASVYSNQKEKALQAGMSERSAARIARELYNAKNNAYKTQLEQFNFDICAELKKIQQSLNSENSSPNIETYLQKIQVAYQALEQKVAYFEKTGEIESGLTSFLKQLWANFQAALPFIGKKDTTKTVLKEVVETKNNFSFFTTASQSGATVQLSKLPKIEAK